MSTIYLMNPHTGTVMTEAEWADEGFTIDNAELVEVVKVAVKTVNDNGIEQQDEGLNTDEAWVEI